MFSDNNRQAELAQQHEVAAADLGVTLAQYLSMIQDDVDLPMAEVAYKYKAGDPLLRSPEEIANLSTKMRRLHQWYMHASKRGLEYITLAIKDEHFFRGDNEIHVEMGELFQLYNQDAIDVAVVSCYCL